MDALPRHDIGIGRSVKAKFDATLVCVENALKAEGFGILTRIDVKATLKEKLGVDVLRRTWLNVDLIWAVVIMTAGLLTLFT